MVGAYTVDTDHLSESVDGRPIRIASVSDVLADPVHLISNADGVLDHVWMTAHNRSTGTVNIQVVVNPVDATNATDVGNASWAIQVPAKFSVPIFEGLRVRKNSAVYTIGVYIPIAGDTDKIQITGWVNRTYSAAISF